MREWLERIKASFGHFMPQQGYVYRKPIILLKEDNSAIVCGHFDDPAHDPYSVTTGRIMTLNEIDGLIMGHVANKSPLPPRIPLDELIRGHCDIQTTIYGVTTTNSIDVHRLPVWRGNPQDGPWETETSEEDLAVSMAQPIVAGAVGPDEQNIAVPLPLDSKIVKVTVQVDGHPSDRLAVRIGVPLNKSDEMKLKSDRINESIYLPEELGFHIEHIKRLEEKGHTKTISSEILLQIDASLAMAEADVSTGKKTMSAFDAVPGIFRAYNTPAPQTAAR